MQRLPNGGARYTDDFWLEETFLFIVLVASPAAAWVELARQAPNYVLALCFVVISIVAAYGLFTAQRRIFLFSPATSILTWTTRGWFVRGGGEVEFKDIVITVDAARSFSWFGRRSPLNWLGGLASPTQYDIMLTTPLVRAYLWRSFRGEYAAALAEATELRELLGQNAGSLVDDSIAQMLRDGNTLGAKHLERERSKSSISRSLKPFGAQAP
jgi:hypothetical protein